MKRTYIMAVVNRFERAVENYVFRGTIPCDESYEAAEAYNAVCAEYVRAKNSLVRMIHRLNSQPRLGK